MGIGDPLTRGIRLELFDLLRSGEASTDELRRQLPDDPSLETVAYHLAVLEHKGLIERDGGVWRRR